MVTPWYAAHGANVPKLTLAPAGCYQGCLLKKLHDPVGIASLSFISCVGYWQASDWNACFKNVYMCAHMCFGEHNEVGSYSHLPEAQRITSYWQWAFVPFEYSHASLGDLQADTHHTKLSNDSHLECATDIWMRGHRGMWFWRNGCSEVCNAGQGQMLKINVIPNRDV